MLTKNERMNKLEEAGIKTDKYFTIDLENGTKIHLIIDENGNPVRVDNKENDPILNEIISDGYVRNTRLHRRFVCAQMFHMLNYVSYHIQKADCPCFVFVHNLFICFLCLCQR